MCIVIDEDGVVVQPSNGRIIFTCAEDDVGHELCEMAGDDQILKVEVSEGRREWMGEQGVSACEPALFEVATDDDHVVAVDDEAAGHEGGCVTEVVESDLGDPGSAAGAESDVGDEASLEFLVSGEPVDAGFVVPQDLSIAVEAKAKAGSSGWIGKD